MACKQMLKVGVKYANSTMTLVGIIDETKIKSNENAPHKERIKKYGSWREKQQ